jgi:hypothetical protein
VHVDVYQTRIKGTEATRQGVCLASSEVMTALPIQYRFSRSSNTHLPFLSRFGSRSSCGRTGCLLWL